MGEHVKQLWGPALGDAALGIKVSSGLYLVGGILTTLAIFPRLGAFMIMVWMVPEVVVEHGKLLQTAIQLEDQGKVLEQVKALIYSGVVLSALFTVIGYETGIAAVPTADKKEPAAKKKAKA